MEIGLCAARASDTACMFRLREDQIREPAQHFLLDEGACARGCPRHGVLRECAYEDAGGDRQVCGWNVEVSHVRWVALVVTEGKKVLAQCAHDRRHTLPLLRQSCATKAARRTLQCRLLESAPACGEVFDSEFLEGSEAARQGSRRGRSPDAPERLR